MKDCFNKRRINLPTLQGEDHGCVKLTKEQVLDIRRISNDFTRTELAKRFKVSQVQISNIVLRKKWKHI
jgi:hypothetical protein